MPDGREPTKRLYLLRHAKSSWSDPTLPDVERPLTARGHRACERLSRYIAREKVAPELALCSPARRTRDTLEGIAASLGRPPTEIEQSLYAASAAELLHRLQRLPEEISSLILIGHNPGLHELAVLLTGESGTELTERFPTGALATLTHERAWHELAPGTALLRDVVVPRELD